MSLLTVTVLLPLLLLALGVWETSRGALDAQELAVRHEALARGISAVEARTAGHPSMELQFRRNGQLYGGPYALVKAREELGELETALTLSRVRAWLPPAVILCAGSAAALSTIALLAAVLLGRAGRGSRERLVKGFGLVRRLLPVLMGTQVVLMATGFVACVAFEALAIPEAGDYSSGALKLVGIGVVAAGASLWTASRAVLQLRRTAAAFAPEPLTVMGRLVVPADAPGLWRTIDDLAGRLGALRPENVVVGLTGGFFVSSGPKVLQPGGAALAGRTLYLPLPFLPLLRPDETAAIIAHELAHFSGGDTEWSLRFLPIYAGVQRSLEAVVVGGAGSPLASPALRLGWFAMHQFDRAVLHWSRLREFGADAAGAGATSADASARALLRFSAALPRVRETLEAATEAPEAAPVDLVPAVLDHAATQGLDDPAAHLEAEQPHPTDTHPPTSERLRALGGLPGPSLLAQAAAPPGSGDLARLATLFADPAALCRTATADFLDAVRADRRAYRDALAAAAAEVEGGEQVLHEDTRVAYVPLVVAALFVVVGILALVVRWRGLDATEQGIIAATALVLAAAMAVLGLVRLRRGRRPFLVLRPEAMQLTGLDRPIAWDDVADLDMRLERGALTTRVLLPPEAPFPARLPGARRVKLDAGRRIVIIRSGLPRGMKPQGFADLVGRYRRAAEARRLLAAQAADAQGADAQGADVKHAPGEGA